MSPKRTLIATATIALTVGGAVSLQQPAEAPAQQQSTIASSSIPSCEDFPSNSSTGTLRKIKR